MSPCFLQFRKALDLTWSPSANSWKALEYHVTSSGFPSHDDVDEPPIGDNHLDDVLTRQVRNHVRRSESGRLNVGLTRLRIERDPGAQLAVHLHGHLDLFR